MASNTPIKLIINPSQPDSNRHQTIDDIQNSSYTPLAEDQSNHIALGNTLLHIIKTTLLFPLRMIWWIIKITAADLIKTVFVTMLLLTLILITLKQATPSQIPQEIAGTVKTLLNKRGDSQQIINHIGNLVERIGILSKSDTPAPTPPTQETHPYENLNDTSTVIIRFNTTPKAAFYCEVAKSKAKQSLGLMYRTKIPENYCMLFVFTTPTTTPFWMKNVKIPLDIIFLDKDLKIIRIYKNLSPCNADICPAYAPESPYYYVIEVKGGTTQTLGITKTTTLDINIE